MHEFGFTSVQGFIWGCSLAVFARVARLCPYLIMDVILFGVVGALLSRFVFSNEMTRLPANKPMTSAQVRLRAFFLGWGFSVGLLIYEHSSVHYAFGIYCSVLAFFHYTEFLTTALINPETTSLDSFLLNHSIEYGIAALASVIEFFVEGYFSPGMKQIQPLIILGSTVCFLGEMLRKGAMLNAWSNFTHLVREKKVQGHVLITHGLYSICRHPGYAGWFWWSVGTQVIMANPVCFVGYAFASTRFFQNRIYYEEAFLLSFFTDYANYQKSVPRTGVPFAEGFVNVRSTS